VTISAGLMKIFSADPRLGFLSHASVLRGNIAAGGTEKQLAQWSQLLTSNYVNSIVTGAFLALVLLVVGVSACQWWRLLTKRETPVLTEEPWVAVKTKP
jgi:carbon starvation protein